uniref:Uncharacterized protein n=1 Tax=virus sp. ctML55 TaxID=2827627 RepID=A0A8S5RI53_9VIRU|nr:MAG TPA: hypothetical protein [virus sp. ctML55]
MRNICRWCYRTRRPYAEWKFSNLLRSYCTWIFNIALLLIIRYRVVLVVLSL